MSKASELADSSEDYVSGWIVPLIEDWVLLTRDLQQCLWETLRDPGTDSVSHFAAVQLCARINNELRSAALLVRRGYSVQAYAPVATMAELAYIVGSIANDEDEARRWTSYDDDRRFFVKVLPSVKTTLRNLGFSEADADAEFAHYRHLCMAKHGNPKVFRNFGYLEEGGRVVTFHGPYDSPEILYLSRAVLWYACYYAWLGLLCYQRFHTPKRLRELRTSQLKMCQQTMDRLRDADVARYEAENPSGDERRTIVQAPPVPPG